MTTTNGEAGWLQDISLVQLGQRESQSRRNVDGGIERTCKGGSVACTGESPWLYQILQAMDPLVVDMFQKDLMGASTPA